MRRHFFRILVIAAALGGAGGCGDDEDVVLCPDLAGTGGAPSRAGWNVGDQVLVRCPPGTMPQSSQLLTCLEDGTWSGPYPCRTVCLGPSAPANGTVSNTGQTVGSTATYTCNDGFELFGPAVRTCESTSRWSGPDPTCVVKCPCYTSADLDRIAADTAAGGQKSCSVDGTSGGTTRTQLASAHPTHHLAAEALEDASLPGTHLACGAGCVDDTPGDGADQCGALAAYTRTDDISAAQHATCRALVVVRCGP